MSFKLYSTSDGRVPPVEYLPISAITPKVGMMLTVSAGKLAIATGTTVPSYVCCKESDRAETAGTLVPVFRVDKDMIFETTNSATLSAAIGAKVTLHATSGLQVTGTTTDGIAEIVYKSGNDAGSAVRVRF